MSETAAHRYQRIRLTLVLLELLVTLQALLVWNLWGIAFRVREGIETLASSIWIQVAVYTAALSFFLYLSTCLLHFCRSYYLEKAFDLSRQRLREWLWREVKGGLLSLSLFVFSVEVGYACIRHSSRFWWLWFGFFWFLMSWGLTQFFPTFIVPLFYRYGRVEDPALVERLKDFLQQEGCRLEGIWTINLSKETTKANAALMGLGRSRRVVLGDTLVKNFSPEEIQVVVAHEWGHWKCRHLVKSLFFSGAVNFFGFFAMGKILRHLLVPPRYTGLTDPAGLSLFLFAFTLYGVFLLPLQNGLSRFFEREADAYALRVTRARETFISAMQKLALTNLADLRPNPWVEFLFYDHPSIGKRIAFAEKF